MKYSLRVAQVRAFVQLAGLALAALPFQLLALGGGMARRND